VTTVGPALDVEVTALLRGRRLADPNAVFRRLREESPLFRSGWVVLVTRFPDVRVVLSDQERFANGVPFSGERFDELTSELSEEARRMLAEMMEIDANVLTRTDEAQHDRLRRITHRFFTPRKVAELTDDMQRFVDELLEQAAASGTYDHTRLSRDLALRVMTRVLGIPDVDRDYLAQLATRVCPSPTMLMLGGWGGPPQEEAVRAAHAARRELNAYIEDVILAPHRRERSNALVAALMDAADGDNLTAGETTMVARWWRASS
jgi:cytochrome P450